jgi:hypothetical protein
VAAGLELYPCQQNKEQIYFLFQHIDKEQSVLTALSTLNVVCRSRTITGKVDSISKG